MNPMINTFQTLDLAQLPTPCYVVDEVLLERNLQLLQEVKNRSGAKILLALKGFAMWHYAPLIMRYLDGVCASGLHEAQLGKDYFGGEIHTFAAAYPPADIEEVLLLSHHMVFNSFHQYQRFSKQIQATKAHNPHLSIGLRINPQRPEGEYPIYDPSTPGSRLGIVRSEFTGDLTGIDGIHVHNLCEQNVQPLVNTIAALEEKFGEFLPQMKWVNLGGGHHITRSDYEVERLIEVIQNFRQKWDVEVILEPGEAIALGTGAYVCEVLDVVKNDLDILIVDGSCTAHLPDVLEMPYRPELLHAALPSEKAHTYRIGGLSCLSGDVIGDYSFDRPIAVGDRLLFLDMAHYTMVKNNTFNGVKLPAIVAWNSEKNTIKVVKSFGYADFRDRLS